MSRQKYDADTETLWVEFDLGADELVSRQTLDKHRALLKQGETEDGDPLETVYFVFTDKEAALYNRQPLAFVGIEPYVGTLEDNEPLHNLEDEDGPEFTTEEDFRIE